MGAITIPSDFGYIAFVAVAAFVTVTYLALKVGRARAKYGVKYPTMYSDTSVEFNCIQRAHQNTLENYPMFLVFLLLGGLQLPRLSAVFGLIYLAGRIVYAHGYYTFKPANRNRGAFGYIGFFGLLINTVIFGLVSTGFV